MRDPPALYHKGLCQSRARCDQHGPSVEIPIELNCLIEGLKEQYQQNMQNKLTGIPFISLQLGNWLYPNLTLH